MLKNKKIVVTGGGTAGHVFPILAVAEILRRRGAQILYLGTSLGIERKIVGNKLPYQSICAGKLRRYFSLYTLWDFLKLGAGIIISLYRLICFKPDLVFAKGGFVSLPVLIAAKILKIKIVNHESDMALGLANQLAHRWAEKSCFGFDLIYYQGIDLKKSIFTGTPARPGFTKALRQKKYRLFGFDHSLPVLLIFGGSQGSHFINQAIQPKLEDYLNKFQLIHMTGTREYKRYIKIKNHLPIRLKKRYFVSRFLDNQKLTAGFATADLIIARAGASTLAEISLAKKPAILIPLPWAAGNHQAKNAKVYTRQDAAMVMPQTRLTAQKLFDAIQHLINDPAELKLMSKRIGRMAEPRSAHKIAGVISRCLDD